jgi:hypothetical protein
MQSQASHVHDRSRKFEHDLAEALRECQPVRFPRLDNCALADADRRISLCRLDDAVALDLQINNQTVAGIEGQRGRGTRRLLGIREDIDNLSAADRTMANGSKKMVTTRRFAVKLDESASNDIGPESETFMRRKRACGADPHRESPCFPTARSTAVPFRTRRRRNGQELKLAKFGPAFQAIPQYRSPRAMSISWADRVKPRDRLSQVSTRVFRHDLRNAG